MVPTYCLKGHFIGCEDDRSSSDWSEIQSRHYEREFVRDGKLLPAFCPRCGSRNIDACENCKTPLYAGSDGGCPLYCGGCGKPLPWTESGLMAASAYTDELAGFSVEEKTNLKESFKDLTTNTPATPLAASRLRRAIDKAGPRVGSAILDIAKALATGEAKKYLGL